MMAHGPAYLSRGPDAFNGARLSSRDPPPQGFIGWPFYMPLLLSGGCILIRLSGGTSVHRFPRRPIGAVGESTGTIVNFLLQFFVQYAWNGLETVPCRTVYTSPIRFRKRRRRDGTTVSIPANLELRELARYPASSDIEILVLIRRRVPGAPAPNGVIYDSDLVRVFIFSRPATPVGPLIFRIRGAAADYLRPRFHRSPMCLPIRGWLDFARESCRSRTRGRVTATRRETEHGRAFV